MSVFTEESIDFSIHAHLVLGRSIRTRTLGRRAQHERIVISGFLHYGSAQSLSTRYDLSHELVVDSRRRFSRNVRWIENSLLQNRSVDILALLSGLNCHGNVVLVRKCELCWSDGFSVIRSRAVVQDIVSLLPL